MEVGGREEGGVGWDKGRGKGGVQEVSKKYQ